MPVDVNQEFENTFAQLTSEYDLARQGIGLDVPSLAPADVSDYKVYAFQTATRLSNGNTLINNWTNQWHDKIDPSDTPVQAWEISPDKKVVWALRSWTDPTNLGPATIIQLLDEPTIPEQVRFGSIK